MFTPAINTLAVPAARNKFEEWTGTCASDRVSHQAMRSYGQFCPIAQALEILAERWTLLVVRELLCGSERFGEILHGVPLMPRSVLSQRLTALEDSGVVRRTERAGARGHLYQLTDAGEALRPLVLSLGDWGKRWVKSDLSREHLDPTLLLWDVHRRIDHSHVPEGRVVVRFEFPDAIRAKRRIWLALEDGEADVCYTNPGYDTDLVVATTVHVLTEVWRGNLDLQQAIRSGEIGLEGAANLKELFPKWLQLSVFAERGRQV